MKKRKNDWLQLFAEEAAGSELPAAEAPAAAEGEAPREETQEIREDPVDPALVQRHWQAVDGLYQQLAAQAEELKQLYPDFDPAGELRDPRFAGMLRCGVDMRSAFHALHSSEILPAAMQYAARTVEQRLASAMCSGAVRPAENGIRSGSAAILGSDAARMSRQDYARVCRMVERGERVSFG